MKINQTEKINLTELINIYQIPDQDYFGCYIRETWSSLSSKTKKKIKGVDKNMFINYYELPGILSDRLFSVLDKNNDGILGEEEFTKGMLKLFSVGKSLNSLVKFIFKIYDFDKDGKINKEDVRLILSYVYLYNVKTDEKYKFYIEYQNQLQNLLEIVFKNNEMDVNDFMDLVKNSNSDIFFPILIILLEKRPFSSESISLYNENKNIEDQNDSNSNFELKVDKIPLPSLYTLLMFQNIKKKILYQKLNFNHFLTFNLLSLYGINDEKIEMPDKEEFEEKPIFHEGYMYKIFKDKVKKIYFRLLNKDLYFYKNKEEKRHRGILNLSGVFVKESEDEVINDKKYYSIASTYKEKRKLYYFDNIENRNIWLGKFKLVTEKKNIYDNYELSRIIGKGKYGIVRYGNNIKTG